MLYQVSALGDIKFIVMACVKEFWGFHFVINCSYPPPPSFAKKIAMTIEEMEQEQLDYVQLSLPKYIRLAEAAEKDDDERDAVYQFVADMEEEWLVTWPPKDTLVVRHELPLAALLSPTWRPSPAQVILILEERQALIDVSHIQSHYDLIDIDHEALIEATSTVASWRAEAQAWSGKLAGSVGDVGDGFITRFFGS